MPHIKYAGKRRKEIKFEIYETDKWQSQYSKEIKRLREFRNIVG